MSCDPNGYPWRADGIDPSKVPKAGSPAWNERGDYVTPPMTTPSDDPREDDGLADDELVAVMARAMVESDVRKNNPSWRDEDVEFHLSRIAMHAPLRRARAALTAARSHRGM